MSTLTNQKSAPRSKVLSWLNNLLENEASLGYLLLIPTVVVVLGLISYPFILSVYYSFTDKVMAKSDFVFVGLKNYIALFRDPIFRQTIRNTFNYTVTAVIFKMLLGLLMALTLNAATRFRKFFRAAFLLPWVVPSSLSVLAWKWIFDPQFSIITYFLRDWGLISERIPWLGDATFAMAAVQTVNIWRGVPFFAMILLAGLVTVPQDLYEAATVDGANALQRFRYITFPHILPILIVAALYSFIQTMGDFQIVWLITQGGPLNKTHLIATLAFRSAIQGANTAKGSAIAVFLFPFLVLIIALQLRYLRQE